MNTKEEIHFFSATKLLKFIDLQNFSKLFLEIIKKNLFLNRLHKKIQLAQSGLTGI